MCGIAGIVHPEPSSLGLEMLGRMSEMLSHRGPDARGTFADDHAGLAHTRLSIIDLQGGGQPMGNEDGSLQIVFNGEIFNYLELREDLIKRGHHFATRSDTEVILHSFEEFGEDCVQRMNGQWAFAIWDRMKRSLFLSRDRMGVRPLFYAFAGRTFLFGSEIKALLVHPGVKRTLDLRALDEIFTFWHCLPPNTAFEGVRELPPGHSATLAKGRLTIRKYWELQFPESSEDGQGASEEERSAELLELLRDATRIRLRADVPVGAYLSGGLDSTVVTALARQFVPHRLRTFSIRFDDAEFDEGAYQQAAIRHLQTDHQEIYCDGATIGRVFPDVIWHAEKPILRTAPAPLFLLSKLVHESGFKVVLTGEGSDEVLGGYDIFKEYKIRHFWAAHQDSRLRPLLLRRLYPYLKNIGAQPEAYLNAFFHPDAAEQEDPFSSHQPRWRLTSGLKLFYSADVKAELNGRQPADDLGLRLPPAFLKWNGFHRAQYLEASYLLPGYILSSQGDRVAMAHAVEGRFPFLDCRVVEFAAALPPRLKMKVLQEKYLLKRCARGLVPDAVIRRHKQPYRAPDARSFFPGGRPLDYIDALLSADRIRQDGVFEPAAVQRLVEKARRGNLAGLRDNMAMVGIVSTQLLLHRFGRDFHVEEQHNGERS
ncbi:MAG: asparagine synthase (glutamine-hydrolyzing) [Actinobacteria bacterium]|nr:asparagine synthase (glutamine-hydrolyzing) [Actinomycetota bacterium]